MNQTATPPADPSALKLLNPKDPGLLDFMKRAGELKAAAGSYVIDSAEMYELGTEEIRSIKIVFDQVEAKRDSIVRPLNTAVKNTNALFKPITEALDGAKRTLGNAMLAFENEQRRLRREEEDRAHAAQQEEVRAAEVRLAEAEAAGNEAAKEVALIETQMAAIAAPVAEVGKVDRGGHSRRDSFTVEIEDVPTFLIWIAGQMRQYPERFDNTVTFKVSQLNAFATQTQGETPIPGAVVKAKSTLAVRK